LYAGGETFSELAPIIDGHSNVDGHVPLLPIEGDVMGAGNTEGGDASVDSEDECQRSRWEGFDGSAFRRSLQRAEVWQDEIRRLLIAKLSREIDIR
jgi:hypothetical protein